MWNQQQEARGGLSATPAVIWATRSPTQHLTFLRSPKPHEEHSVGLRIRSGFENQLDPFASPPTMSHSVSSVMHPDHTELLCFTLYLTFFTGIFPLLGMFVPSPWPPFPGLCLDVNCSAKPSLTHRQSQEPYSLFSRHLWFLWSGLTIQQYNAPLWICLHLWTGSSLKARPSIATSFQTVSRVQNSLIHIGCITIIFQMNEWESKIL